MNYDFEITEIPIKIAIKKTNPPTKIAGKVLLAMTPNKAIPRPIKPIEKAITFTPNLFC